MWTSLNYMEYHGIIPAPDSQNVLRDSSGEGRFNTKCPYSPLPCHQRDPVREIGDMKSTPTNPFQKHDGFGRDYRNKQKQSQMTQSWCWYPIPPTQSAEPGLVEATYTRLYWMIRNYCHYFRWNHLVLCVRSYLSSHHALIDLLSSIIYIYRCIKYMQWTCLKNNDRRSGWTASAAPCFSRRTSRAPRSPHVSAPIARSDGMRCPRNATQTTWLDVDLPAVWFEGFVAWKPGIYMHLPSFTTEVTKLVDLDWNPARLSSFSGTIRVETYLGFLLLFSIEDLL